MGALPCQCSRQKGENRNPVPLVSLIPLFSPGIAPTPAMPPPRRLQSTPGTPHTPLLCDTRFRTALPVLGMPTNGTAAPEPEDPEVISKHEIVTVSPALAHAGLGGARSGPGRRCTLPRRRARRRRLLGGLRRLQRLGYRVRRRSQGDQRRQRPHPELASRLDLPR